MSAFTVVKYLDERENYVEVDEVCPDCESKMYIEMSKDELQQLEEQLGESFDIEMAGRNKFCWPCERQNLKDLKEYIEGMDRGKAEAIERMKLGAFQQNDGQIFMALNQLCQVFTAFMDLFQFHIAYPEDENEVEEVEEEESLIIAP